MVFGSVIESVQMNLCDCMRMWSVTLPVEAVTQCFKREKDSPFSQLLAEISLVLLKLLVLCSLLIHSSHSSFDHCQGGICLFICYTLTKGNVIPFLKIPFV